MGPSQTARRSGDGWRGALLKGLLALFFTVATWWTGYVWARMQEIPRPDDVTKWRTHVSKEYPDLLRDVAVITTQQENTQDHLREIKAQLTEIERLLREGKR